MNKYSYPDPFATNEKKQSDKYGLQYAKYIESEWFNGRFSKRNTEFRELEAFKNNQVNTEKYKHMLGMCEDRIWTGMNWEFIPIAPKFINVIKDGFATDLFKIQAKAKDTLSQKEKKAFRKKLEDEMLTANFSRMMSAATGTDYTSSYTPESDEEIDIYMQLKYKQPREIAAELIINRVLDYNGWEETKNRIIEDIIVKGIAAAKITPDKDYGVIAERIEPENLIYSYDTKSSRNKKGVYYFGEVKHYTISEISKMSNLSEDEINKTIGLTPSSDSSGADQLVNVMYFCFKTTAHKTYKRKINNLIPKPADYKLPENSKSKIIKGTHEVWFEGYYIPGTEILWGYRLMEDMIRPAHNINKVMPPYVVYELSVPSVIENIKPYCEDAHIAILKLRHLVLNARPKGYQIDIDVLKNIDVGSGNVLKPIEIINIYNQTGNLLVSSRGFDEDEKDFRSAIKEINTTLGTDIVQLINVYNNAVNMCYEVSGLNRVRDGSAPINNTLVGTQQIALSMSNTATKHILNAILNMETNAAEIILNRSQQLSMYGDRFAEEIMEVFLDQEEKVKNEFLSSHKYNFDIIIEVSPDRNEWQAFEQNILAALQSGQITLPDAITLRTIKNLKLASEYLKLLIKKREKEKREYEKIMIREKENARAQAEIAIQQTKIQSLQSEAQLVQLKAQAEISVNNAKVEKEVEGKLLIMRQQNVYDMKLKGIEVTAATQLNKFKEDAKDNRAKIQADLQSKMIYQRQNGTPPENFTNSENYNVDNTRSINQEELSGSIQYDLNNLYGQGTFNESGQIITPNGTEETTIQQTV